MTTPEYSALLDDPSPQGVGARPRVSIRESTAWNFVGSMAPMALGFFTIKYMVPRVGVESFGILTLVWALIGYFSVFDFGIGRALTQQVSTRRSMAGGTEVHGLVRSGLQFMVWTGLFGGVLLAALATPLGHRWLNVSEPLRDETMRCLLIAAVGIPLTTITSGLKGVLEGYEDFRASSLLRLVLGLMNFGFPALTVALFGPSLVYMVGSLVLGRAISLVAHIWVVHRWVSITSVLSAAGSKAGQTIELIRFGAWMTVSNIISPLMVTADRFVVSAVLGASVVAYYTVPFDAIVRLLIIPASLTGALFPRFAYLQNDRPGVKALVDRSLKVVFLVMAGVTIISAAGSYIGLSIWMGREFAERSWVITSILSLGILINSIAQVPHTVLQALGGVKTTALAHAAEFLVYVPVLVIALRLFGLPGAAVAWVIRSTIDLGLLMYFARRKIR